MLHFGGTSDQQTDLREEVAVKILEDGADEGIKMKFLQEAAIMGQFNHPNIIMILGVIIDEPVCYVLLTTGFKHGTHKKAICK